MRGFWYAFNLGLLERLRNPDADGPCRYQGLIALAVQFFLVWSPALALACPSLGALGRETSNIGVLEIYFIYLGFAACRLASRVGIPWAALVWGGTSPFTLLLGGTAAALLPLAAESCVVMPLLCWQSVPAVDLVPTAIDRTLAALINIAGTGAIAVYVCVRFSHARNQGTHVAATLSRAMLITPPLLALGALALFDVHLSWLWGTLSIWTPFAAARMSSIWWVTLAWTPTTGSAFEVDLMRAWVLLRLFVTIALPLVLIKQASRFVKAPPP